MSKVGDAAAKDAPPLLDARGRPMKRLGPAYGDAILSAVVTTKMPRPGQEGLRVAEWIDAMANQEVEYGDASEIDFIIRLMRNVALRIRCGEHLVSNAEADALRRAGKLPPLL